MTSADVVSRQAWDSLSAVLDRARRTLTFDIEEWLRGVIEALPKLDESTQLSEPAQRITPFIVKATDGRGGQTESVACAAVVAYLALQLPDRLPAWGLPRSVLNQFPHRIEQLSSFLTSPDAHEYTTCSDAFLKDLRTAGGYSAPCGAQDVDLHGTLSRSSGLKSMVTQRDVTNGWRVIRLGGPPWFQIHTDSRYTDDFNESGWERCYHRIADLLATRPHIKGMVGISWFYDPQLLQISPRLAYLQRTPTSNGAFLMRNGQGKIHAERATATSATRRALYQSGAYMPTCYTLIWPRTELLDWSLRMRQP